MEFAFLTIILGENGFLMLISSVRHLFFKGRIMRILVGFACLVFL